MAQPAPTKLARAGRILAALAICSVGACVLAFAAPHNAEKSDFITYWAAGQQLAHRLNPYDGAAILRLQQQAGYTATQPFFMRNPPWAFWLALPLGFVDTAVGSFFWSCAILAALIVSIRLFWKAAGVHDENLRLVSYAFAPAAFCLLQQQIGVFLLLGFGLFLYWLRDSSSEKHRPSLAGAALLLPALKPHLVLPFWIALLLWSMTRRRYSVLAGLLAALAASVALAFALDPACFQHYSAMVQTANIQNDFIPSLAQLLRISIAPRWSWLQLLPAALACIWSVWYFLNRRVQWSWTTHGALVLLVSVMTAPYAWFSDQSVLLIAIMAGLAYAADKRSALTAFGVLTAIAFAEMVFGLPPRSWWYIWTTPAWLLWYLYAARKTALQTVPAPAISA
jgi:hypothetical protein